MNQAKKPMWIGHVDRLAGMIMKLPAKPAQILVAICLLLVSAVTVGSEQQVAAPCDAGAARSNVDEPTIDLKTSPGIHGPVTIKVGLFVNELREINAVADTFRLLGTMTASWCDPRLAFDRRKAGKEVRSFHGQDGETETQRIWTIQAFPVNQVGAISAPQRVIHERFDGLVSVVINVDIRLSTDYDLRRFPFDQQTLTLDLESFAWNADQVVFVADESTSGFADDFVMPEWTIVDASANSTLVDVARAEESFSRFTLAIVIDRKSGFYVWKVLLPLLIIVALSWSVFWMRDEKFAVRVRTSATGILTIVAYQFMAAKDLPRVAYLTLIDKIMVASFILLAITVIESLVISRITDQGLARKIDRKARWVFPLSYALIILLVVLSSTR
jgi:hypothetical protein